MRGAATRRKPDSLHSGSTDNHLQVLCIILLGFETRHLLTSRRLKGHLRHYNTVTDFENVHTISNHEVTS